MKSVTRIILERTLGLLLTLLFLIFAKMLIHSDIVLVQEVSSFILDNGLLLIVISLLFMLSDILSVLNFPINIPYPVFNAFGAIGVIRFLVHIMQFLDSLLNMGIAWLFDIMGAVASPLVFLIVVVVGYVNIFSRIFKKQNPEKDAQSVTWDEIGDEFRKTIKDILTSIRRNL